MKISTILARFLLCSCANLMILSVAVGEVKFDAFESPNNGNSIGTCITSGAAGVFSCPLDRECYYKMDLSNDERHYFSGPEHFPIGRFGSCADGAKGNLIVGGYFEENWSQPYRIAAVINKGKVSIVGNELEGNSKVNSVNRQGIAVGSWSWEDRFDYHYGGFMVNPLGKIIPDLNAIVDGVEVGGARFISSDGQVMVIDGVVKGKVQCSYFGVPFPRPIIVRRNGKGRYQVEKVVPGGCGEPLEIMEEKSEIFLTYSQNSGEIRIYSAARGFENVPDSIRCKDGKWGNIKFFGKSHFGPYIVRCGLSNPGLWTRENGIEDLIDLVDLSKPINEKGERIIKFYNVSSLADGAIMLPADVISRTGEVRYTTLVLFEIKEDDEFDGGEKQK